jgi:hypothetical protein
MKILAPYQYPSTLTQASSRLTIRKQQLVTDCASIDIWRFGKRSKVVSLMLTRVPPDISPDPLAVHPSVWRNDRHYLVENPVKISINSVICSVDSSCRETSAAVCRCRRFNVSKARGLSSALQLHCYSELDTSYPLANGELLAHKHLMLIVYDT